MRSSLQLRTPLLLITLAALSLPACGRIGRSVSTESSDQLLPILPSPVISNATLETRPETEAAACGIYQEMYTARFASAPTLAAVMESLRQELVDYDLNFLVDVPASMDVRARGNENWRALHESDLPSARKLAATFAVAWKRNSVAWSQRSGLKTVVFVSALQVVGVVRSAKPDIAHHAVWYDASLLGQCRPANEEILHHEFYHLAEATQHGTYYYRDPNWTSLNPWGFRYGSGGASAYGNPDYHRVDHPAEGFVSEYSQYGLEEDKAEVYAWMRTPTYAERVVEWSKSDTYLAEKVSYLRKFIASIEK